MIGSLGPIQMKEVWSGREARAKGHVSSMCNNNNKYYIKKIKRIHDKKSLKTVKLRKKSGRGIKCPQVEESWH